MSEKSAPLVWGKAATLLLIDECKKKSKIVDSGRMTKKTMWLEISKTLNDKGYLYNAEQVSGRWKTLNRAYKNVKDQNRKVVIAEKTSNSKQAWLICLEMTQPLNHFT